MRRAADRRVDGRSAAPAGSLDRRAPGAVCWLVMLGTAMMIMLSGCSRLRDEAAFLDDRVGAPAVALYAVWGPALVARQQTAGGVLEARYDARQVNAAVAPASPGARSGAGPGAGPGGGAVSVRGPATAPTVVVQDAPWPPASRDDDTSYLLLQCSVVVTIGSDDVVLGWRYVDPACPARHR